MVKWSLLERQSWWSWCHWQWPVIIGTKLSKRILGRQLLKSIEDAKCQEFCLSATSLVRMGRDSRWIVKPFSGNTSPLLKGQLKAKCSSESICPDQSAAIVVFWAADGADPGIWQPSPLGAVDLGVDRMASSYKNRLQTVFDIQLYWPLNMWTISLCISEIKIEVCWEISKRFNSYFIFSMYWTWKSSPVINFECWTLPIHLSTFRVEISFCKLA